MKKTIILSERQINEVLGANSAYLDAAGAKDFKEFPGAEVSAEVNSSEEDGKPVTTDKIANSLSVKDGFWRTRGGQRGGIGSLNCSKESKKKILESNSDLEGRFFSLDPSTYNELVKTYNDSVSSFDAKGRQTLEKIIKDKGLEYTNATTIKSRLDKLKKDSAEYSELGGRALHRFLNMTLTNATTAIEADKQRRKNNGEENVFQKAGGTKDSGNGEGHFEKTNIIMK